MFPEEDSANCTLHMKNYANQQASATLLGVLKVVFHLYNFAIVPWSGSSTTPHNFAHIFTNISATLHNFEYSIDLHNRWSGLINRCRIKRVSRAPGKTT